MNNVKIYEKLNEHLSIDPIANIEKFVNKHHSQFNENEQLLLLQHAYRINQMKEEKLKQLGDTTFSMKWDFFMNLITSQGFVRGYEYEFKYKNGLTTERAGIYYHPEKSLIIWVNSFSNGTTVNGGNLYGQLNFTKHPLEYKTETDNWGERKVLVNTPQIKQASKALNGCSHSSIYGSEDKGIHFNRDIRSGLFNQLYQIEKEFEYQKIWKANSFLWFLDYEETKAEGYDYKLLTKQKIEKCPQELQNIVQNIV